MELWLGRVSAFDYSVLMIRFAFAAALVLLSFPAFAEDNPREGSGLPLPRFASLKSSNVFARTGPSLDYPIRWIYKREGLPVEIVQEFDVWRKIKDPAGETSWVHKILLSGSRTVMVAGKTPITAMSEAEDGRAVAKLEPGVIANVAECSDSFCKLELVPFEGWVQKKFLWGVYPSEILN